MPIWIPILVLFALIVVCWVALEGMRNRSRRRRLCLRTEWGRDQLLIGIPDHCRDEIWSALTLLAGRLSCEPGQLRPTDRFDQELSARVPLLGEDPLLDLWWTEDMGFEHPTTAKQLGELLDTLCERACLPRAG